MHNIALSKSIKIEHGLIIEIKTINFYQNSIYGPGLIRKI